LRASGFVFVVAIAFLSFVWGVSSTTWSIFPHRQIARVLSGLEAWTRLSKGALPLYAIAPEAGATRPDPVTILAGSDSDDLLLVTEGFYFRQDLCPRFGCMAYVATRDGRVVHTWEYDPQALLTDAAFAKFKGTRTETNLNVQGVDIDAEGNLVVVFQGKNLFPYQVGIAKFSWAGDLLWIRIDNSHHWPKVGPDGRIYAPIAKIVSDDKTVAATKEELKCRNGAVFQEGVQILAADGTELRRFWLDEVVQKSDLQGLAYTVRNDCDPFHVNGVDLLNAAAAARIPGAAAGDLLVSLRSSSSLVVMDQTDGHIKKIIYGPMVAQHSPRVLPDGRIAVFDNMGGIDTKGGTRILAIDPASGADETLFPRYPDQPGGDIFTKEQGEVNFSADGQRMLVSETLAGRVFEVDARTGRALWRLDMISDMRPFYDLMGETAPDNTFTRIQAQGVRYLSAADVVRWSGGRLSLN
jgi:sugar lactone lactonase YvrE